VECAIICQIKTEQTTHLARLAAMDDRNPLFAYMSGKDGSLLMANVAALHKWGVPTAGRSRK